MNAKDQDAVIGSMVRERRALMTEINCIDTTLYRASEGLNAARVAADRARGEDYGDVETTIEYPDAGTLASHIQRLQEARSRLAELNKQLDGC